MSLPDYHTPWLVAASAAGVEEWHYAAYVIIRTYQFLHAVIGHIQSGQYRDVTTE